MATQKQASSLERRYPWLLVIGGAIGLLASVALLIEKIHLLKNPEQLLSCDINPIVACGSVINTPQASVFGFPNPILGLIGFGVVITVGMGLLSGANFKRWFWLGLQAGTLFGVFFIHWLFFQSVFRIGALCPYCMVVWSVTIPIFWYTLLMNCQSGNLPVPSALRKSIHFAQKNHIGILIVWYLIITATILNHFSYYFFGI